MFKFVTHRKGNNVINDRIFKDIDTRPMYLTSYFKQEVVRKYELLTKPVYEEFRLDLFTGSKSHIIVKRFISLTEVVSNFTL